MIALSTPSPLLARFAVELERTTPRPLPAAPVLTGHALADREAARLAWASRIVDEYRSVAVFSELLGCLADLEASLPALCAVQRLIGDELRHTAVTALVVDWLGGRGDLTIDLAEVGLPARDVDESVATRACAIVARELVVAEEESVYVLAAYRDATTEPAIRSVLETILVDEARHAAAGRALFAELAPSPDAGLRAQMAADRIELREGYRRSARGGPGRLLGGSIEVADLEAIWRRV